jgi:hypothetical protein
MLLQATYHPIWYYNPFFYLFIVLLIFNTIVMFVYNKRMRQKSTEMKHTQQQHVAKVDIIRKEQSDTLEKIRVEMLKREEERSRQWMESEKETLHVLNGVSTLLDLSEKIGRVESEKIIRKLEELKTIVEKLPKSD